MAGETTGNDMLVGIGISPESVQKFIQGIKTLTETTGKNAEVKVDVKVNSGGEVAKVASDLDKASEAGTGFGHTVLHAFETRGQGLSRVRGFIGEVSDGLRELKREASQNAADDEKAFSKLDNVFGKLNGEARDFVETFTKTNLGATGSGTATALANLKNIGTSLGFGEEKASTFSQEMLTLASNLAKVNKVGLEEVLSALQVQLLRGGNSAAQYGIRVKQAAVQQELLNKSIDPSTANEEQLAMARLAVIQAQAGDVAAKAAVATKTFGGAQRALSVQTEELLGTLGQEVNRLEGPMVRALTKVVVAVHDFAKANPVVGTAFAVISKGAEISITVLGGVVKVLEGIVAVAGVLAAAKYFNVPALLAGSAAFEGIALQLAFAAGAAKVLFLPALALVGAAIAGFAIGRFIDNFFGISKAFEENSKKSSQAAVDLDRLASVGKKTADVALITSDGMKGLAEHTAAVGGNFKQAKIDATIYSNQIDKIGKANSDGGVSLARFNELLGQGLSPFQAQAQALSEETRLLFLLDEAINGHHDHEEELNKLKEKYPALSKDFQDSIGKEVDGLDAEDKAADSVKKQIAALNHQKEVEKKAAEDAKSAEDKLAEFRAKASGAVQGEIDLIRQKRDEALKTAKTGEQATNIEKAAAAEITLALETERKKQVDDANAAEASLADQRVKSTDTLRDDIALLEKRKQAELAKLPPPTFLQNSPVDQARKAVETKFQAQILAIKEAANKKATDDQKKAEDSLQDSRVKATETIKDDIALERQRAQVAIDAAVTIEQKTALQAAIDTKVRQMEEEDARRRSLRTAQLKNEGVNAELDIEEARAKSTAALGDDLEVMHKRLAAEIELALAEKKSEEEIQAIREKGARQIIKFLEDEERKQKEVQDQKKKSLQDFVDSEKDAADRRAGKGAEVDVRQTDKKLRDQLVNLQSPEDLTKFKKATNDAFGANLDAAKQKTAEALKAFQEAEKHFADVKRQRGAASPEGKEAAADLALKRAAAQQAADEELKIQQDVANRKKAIDADAKAAAEAGERAESQRKHDALDAQLQAEQDQKVKQAQQANGLAQPPVPGGPLVPGQPGAPAPGGVPGQPAPDQLLQVANAQIGALQETINVIRDTLAGGLSTLNESVAVFLSSAGDIQTSASILPEVSSAMDELVSAQSAFLQSISDFGETVIEKFGQTAEQFGSVESSIHDLNDRLASLDLTPDRTAAAAAGAT